MGLLMHFFAARTMQFLHIISVVSCHYPPSIPYKCFIRELVDSLCRDGAGPPIVCVYIGNPS